MKKVYRYDREMDLIAADMAASSVPALQAGRAP
jgi:hypothetical protein